MCGMLSSYELFSFPSSAHRAEGTSVAITGAVCRMCSRASAKPGYNIHEATHGATTSQVTCSRAPYGRIYRQLPMNS